MTDAAPRPSRPRHLTLSQGVLRLSRRAITVLRVTAFAWAVAAIAAFALVFALDLVDYRPGGQTFGVYHRPLLMAGFAVGVLVAVRHEIAGGAVAGFTAGALVLFAAPQLEHGWTVAVSVAFAVPALLWLVIDLHDQRPRTALLGIGVVAAATLAGAVMARQVHDGVFGPTHPRSSAPDLPDEPVSWVWSGAVGTTSATVVAKVADPADVDQVGLLLSTTPSLADAAPAAVEEPDDAGVVRFALTGLLPDTPHLYGLVVDGELAQFHTGRFRTFPDGPASFALAVAACARTGSNGAVFGAIAAERPLLYANIGDFHYGDITDPDRDEIRDVLDHTLTRPAQAHLYRQVPIAYVWDDHDYGGDDSTRFADARPAVMDVYRNVVPHYPLASPDSPIYQAFTVGRVRVIMTDARAARIPPDVAPPGEATMLGEAQTEWLKRELLAAADTHAATIWMNGVSWIAEAGSSTDNWAAFPEEREDLANFIATHDLDDRLVAVTGDAHMLALDDGSNSDYATVGEARFPVLNAAALDRPGSLKGGPYSEGMIAGGGHYGLVEVVDDGGPEVTVRLSGRNWRGEVLMSIDVTLPA